MNNLNRLKIKNETVKMIVEEDLDYSIFAFKNLRRDLIETLKRYSNFDEEKFKLNLKILKNSSMILLVDCEIEGLFLKSHNL